MKRFVQRSSLVALVAGGSRHLPVAPAPGASALLRELGSPGLSRLEWTAEVDHEGDVVTGRSVGQGRIRTIRCYGQAFRFLIPIAALPQWQAVLPARRQTAHKRAPAVDAHLVSNRELNRADDDGWPAQPAAEGAAS